MNYRTTLILLCVLIGVGIALLFVDRGDKKPGEVSSSGEIKLLDIESKDVTRVTIAPADGKRLVIEKNGTDWRLVEPITAGADMWAVDSLVRSLTDLRSRGQVALTSENASTTSLNPPRYQVELVTGNKTVKLKVGSRTAVGDNLYLQLEGRSQADVVAAAEVSDQLEKPFTAYRQMRMVSVSSSDIKQIEITRPDGKIVVNKSGENWQVVLPEKMPAEASEISDLTFAITGLTASEYVNEGDLPSQLLPTRTPRTTVWFSTSSPATQPTTQPSGVTIRFGGYDTVLKQNVYVAVSEPSAMAKVPASSMDKFNKKPLDLRDRNVLKIDPSQVSRVVLVKEQPATTQPTTRPASREEMVIERKKQADAATQPATRPSTMAATQPSSQPALPPTVWTLKSAGDVDASQAEVEAVLNKFSPLKVDKYLAEPLPTAQPAATYTVEITVQAAGGATPVVHRIRLVDLGDAKAVIGQYQNLVFEVPSSFVGDLTKDYANKPESPKPPADGQGTGLPGMGMPGM